jgi:hypothetical protein
MIGNVHGQSFKKLLLGSKRYSVFYGGNVTKQGRQEIKGHVVAK